MAKGNGSSYVKCRVEPGMFKDEWLVYIDAVDPKDRQPAKVQLFVDVRDVRDVQGTPKRSEPAPAWLHVTLAAQRGDLASLVLPQPATPFGENILVRRDLMEEAAVA
jgi:hypothetical protein